MSLEAGMAAWVGQAGALTRGLRALRGPMVVLDVYGHSLRLLVARQTAWLLGPLVTVDESSTLAGGH